MKLFRILLALSLAAIPIACAKRPDINEEAARKKAVFNEYKEQFEETVRAILATKAHPTGHTDISDDLRKAGVRSIRVYSDVIVFGFFSEALDSSLAIVFKAKPGSIDTKIPDDRFRFPFNREVDISDGRWFFVTYD